MLARHTMIQTTYSEAREKLATFYDKAVDDRETVIVKRRGKPDLALIAADELSSLVETNYLLRSPANARALQEAIERADRGEGMVVSDQDLAAIMRDIEGLIAENPDGRGGTSPTLERLVREYEAARGSASAA